MKDLIKENRIGIIKVSKSLLKNLPYNECELFFSMFFPVEISHNFGEEMEYKGYSRYFLSMKEGKGVPLYNAVFEYDKLRNVSLGFKMV